MNDPKIITAKKKHLVGLRITTSRSMNETFSLWNKFMKAQSGIQNKKHSGYFSVQIYSGLESLMSFTGDTLFEKWAALEVDNNTTPPGNMESLLIPAGRYAIFIHKGKAADFQHTANYIFGKWLPESGYTLDDRPHFELMGEKYKGHDNPESEEEVWIPIK